jgi:hypothetical protein
MSANELIYPIFLEVCKYADEDIFWKYVFEDLAYGRAPYGTYITKNFMCCNYKGKEFSYKIEVTKQPEVLFDEIYNLLHTKFGLLSDKDKIKKRQIFDSVNDNKDWNNNWNSIKKKNIKNIIIENFIIKQKTKNLLSIKQARKLLSLIIIGIIFKTITSDDINYENGQINDIEGIKFEEKKICVTKNICDFGSNLLPEIVIEKKTMSDNWDKYISLLKKIK